MRARAASILGPGGGADRSASIRVDLGLDRRDLSRSELIKSIRVNPIQPASQSESQSELIRVSHELIRVILVDLSQSEAIQVNPSHSESALIL